MTKPRESKIEAYFVEQVEKAGGITRKCRWLCRRGAPDRFYAFPNGKHGFVELKRPDRPADPHQRREIARLAGKHVTVFLLDSADGIDRFILENAK